MSGKGKLALGAAVIVGLVLLVDAGCGDDAAQKPKTDLGFGEPAKAKAEEPTQEKTPPAPIDPATVGAIRGVVAFEGTPPEREKVYMAGYADCVSQHQEKPLSENVLVKDGKLQNVCVYVLRGLEGRKFEVPKEPALLDQVGCIYIPHVLAMQTGQALHVKNSDPLLHNVHGISEKGQDFNDAMPNKGGVISKKLKRTEILPVKCDIHPWMRAYVAVLPHPFFAATKEDGAFEIAGLPPGNYTIRAWHEQLGTQDLEVTLGPKETKEVSFTYR